MRIGTLELAAPVLLAPVAGFTILPFRALCRRLGAALTCTEMVSAAGLVRSGRGTLPLLERGEGERPVAAQIFGADPDELAEAARRVEELGFDLVDLNMGCPVPRVTRSGGGAALLCDPARAASLAAAVVAAVRIPVTAKIRAGWESRTVVAPLLARKLAAAGVAAVTVHGRTRSQGYGGRADWEVVAACRAAVAGAIPILGSGDLFRADRCLQVLRDGLCDGIQLARGALANPWLCREVRGLLAGLEAEPVRPGELPAACQELLAWLAARHGPARAARIFRGFFCRLVKGGPGAPQLRKKVFEAESAGAVAELLERAFAGGAGRG